ncbi:DNA replication and repair protein RecN [Flavobacterium croceum DSM 17960]|uniref:DNA repair protein RecN n=1 Tax=Flavobacterium croceum DSM 17960 TaxID=1121886 RepID=A0A2S4NAZ0_9FLAO|nr:DNA repair protein RecN [Flavobacterium croceum]POS02868.1 DNA replication and repair protein RecN [Flavobacterium croceum DSM 17960]
MITNLSVENYALIDKLSVTFTEGFTTITGETGAGKSIILGALGLVLGNRADLNSLKNQQEKCIIEATFFIKNYNLSIFFEENDLDYDDYTIIRREILSTAKSRAFINDTPVNLSVLQELGNYLLDIHSQHQTQELQQENMQFEIVDAVGQNASLLQQYNSLYTQYKQLQKSILGKKNELENIRKEQEYNTYLLEELTNAKLKPDEQEELELSLEKLSNIELIKENLAKVIAISNDDAIGVTNSLNEIKYSLQKISSFDKLYQSLLDRVLSIVIEFDDILKEVEAVTEKIVDNPDELERVSQKLQTIYSLQKKHQVQTITALLSIQSDLERKVVSVTTLEEEIQNDTQLLAQLQLQLDEISLQLRANRTQAANLLTTELVTILAPLGMPNAKFTINIIPQEQFLSNGKDTIEFLFSANKGSSFGLLKKVASGGEMSRIMLAVKYILSRYTHLPTIIFDEIDTGVSGEIAHKMGEIMQQMSRNMQVISITHLPQIAAKGNSHYKVYKEDLEQHTHTRIILLNNEDRVVEVAKMLSGEKISSAALEHAKELLN